MKKTSLISGILIAVISLTFSTVSFAKEGAGLGIAAFGGYHMKKPGSVKNIAAGGRIFGDISMLRIGGDFLMHLKNKGTKMMQGKVVAGVTLGNKSMAIPYILAAGSYNMIDNGVTKPKKMGVGGVAGVEIMLAKGKVGFMLEGVFDMIFTSGSKTKNFGGNGGFTLHF